jgi:hypothetical protein
MMVMTMMMMMVMMTISAVYCAGCSQNWLHAMAVNIKYFLHLTIVPVDDHTGFWWKISKLRLQAGDCLVL